LGVERLLLPSVIGAFAPVENDRFSPDLLALR
jgi:hypothetical protein